jgi:hypothetical protein
VVDGGWATAVGGRGIVGGAASLDNSWLLSIEEARVGLQLSFSESCGGSTAHAMG